MIKPDKPLVPCKTCGSNLWWLRDTGWGKMEYICGGCHPEPNITKGEINE